MKEFDVNAMPKNLQVVVRELPYVVDVIDNGGGAIFKVKTAPDPEWGNMHVPISQWLLRTELTRVKKCI
jgi:hypothetical protein